MALNGAGNPFEGDPGNPFQDPAVTQHRPTSEYATLDVYNPFENPGQRPPPPYESRPSAPVPTPPAPASQPPKKASPTEPRNYGSYGTQESAAAATAELLKRQEELNRKAEELDRRERELQNAAAGGTAARPNNWPPLPSFFPVKPCFYQDISVEIPVESQKTVTTMYYLWMVSTATLYFNFLALLAWFCVYSEGGSGFGLSILWALLFTPCSFLCWYRPMYKAFRSDSSFNFFVFFFIFFTQDVVYVIQCIGIPGSGFRGEAGSGAFSDFGRSPLERPHPEAHLASTLAVGWIVSLSALKVNTGVAILMMLVATLFTAVAVLGVVMLKRIHSLYRRTGASFQKAQEEFAAGVFSNPTVRTAAANAAAGAASSTFRTP